MASGVTGHRAPDDDMKFSHSRSPPHPSFLGSLLRLQLQRGDDGANGPRPSQRAQKEEMAPAEHLDFSPKGRR